MRERGGVSETERAREREKKKRARERERGHREFTFYLIFYYI